MVIRSVRQGASYIFAIKHKREPKQCSWEQNQIKINRLLVSKETCTAPCSKSITLPAQPRSKHNCPCSDQYSLGNACGFRIYITLFHCLNLNVWSWFWLQKNTLDPQNITSSDSDKTRLHAWISSCQSITLVPLTTFRSTISNISKTFCSA